MHVRKILLRTGSVVPSTWYMYTMRVEEQLFTVHTFPPMARHRESRPSRSFLSFLLSLFFLIVFNVYRQSQCFHCQFFPLPFNVAVAGSKTIKEPLPSIQGLSLVTSFWAEKYDEEYKPHAHRREMEAAMLVNLQNPHLRQVVVVLDSVNENTTDCQGFVDYMTKKRDNITRSSSSLLSVFAPSMITTENQTFPQLECIERRGESSGSQRIMKCSTTQRFILPSRRTRSYWPMQIKSLTRRCLLPRTCH